MNIYQHQCSINVWNNKIGRGNGNWSIRTPLLIIFHENGISWSIKQTLVCHTVKTTTISTQQQHLQKHSRCGSSMGEFLSMVWIHTHTREYRFLLYESHPNYSNDVEASEATSNRTTRLDMETGVCECVCEYRIPHIS